MKASRLFSRSGFGRIALFAALATVSAALACRGARTRAAGSEETDGSATNATSGAPTAALEQAEPTYYGRVAGILETHCTKCHAATGIGPMPLSTFEEAKVHAGAIAFQVRERHMPPWLPDTHACAPLRHSRAMPDADVRALERWAEIGAPEGQREDFRPPVVRRTHGTLPPTPDAIAVPDVAYTPKRTRGDDYHCFVLDPKLERPERIVGLRIAPGIAAVVHHVVLYEVRASAVERIRERDEREPGPGYTCFGGIGVTPTVRAGNLAGGELVSFDAQMIVGWAPGGGATDIPGAPTALPSGTAIRIMPGSRLVMQVHYTTANLRAGMQDKTRIEMWLADHAGDPEKGAPRRQAVWVPLLRYDFRVPPGVGPDDARASARADVPLPLPLTVLGVAPHMHLRGKAIRVEAPESPASCLLDVPRWEFAHQEAYWLEKGVRVDKAALTCTWDNRKGRRELHWGEGTDDEMCLAFLYATL